MPPNPLICRAATSCPGWLGRPGYSTVSTAGCSARNSATSAAFSLCRCIRSTSVFSPRMVRYASNGPGTAPAPFCRNANAVVEFFVVGQQRAADDVGVPADVLRRRVQHDVGAQQQRLLQRRRGEGVVHQHLYVRRRRPVAAIGAMSAIDSSGLVGVSTQISLVFAVIAVAHGVEIRQRHRGVVDAPLREHLVDEPEGAAVGVVGDHDVVAGPQHRAQRAVGGRHARAERTPERRLLHRGQRGLQRRARRVAGAGVLEAAAQPADAVLGERRAGVDRRVDGAGGRIGPKPGVDGPGGQALADLSSVHSSPISAIEVQIGRSPRRCRHGP